MGIWEIIGGPVTSYLDVLKQQELAKVQKGKVRAETELERARAAAAKAEAERIAAEKGVVAAEAPSWTKYLPWVALAGIAYFVFKKK